MGIRGTASPGMIWKVYGPDLNGRFGGLQGTGGLEAVILDADGTTTGVINDQFGNGVASVSGWQRDLVYDAGWGVRAVAGGPGTDPDRCQPSGGSNGLEEPPDRSHGLLLARSAVLRAHQRKVPLRRSDGPRSQSEPVRFLRR
jgi:hypothetical protein